jgi:hypothetical protein
MVLLFLGRPFISAFSKISSVGILKCLGVWIIAVLFFVSMCSWTWSMLFLFLHVFCLICVSSIYKYIWIVYRPHRTKVLGVSPICLGFCGFGLLCSLLLLLFLLQLLRNLQPFMCVVRCLLQNLLWSGRIPSRTFPLMCALSICMRSSCIKQYILLLSTSGVLLYFQGLLHRLHGLQSRSLGLRNRLLVVWRYVGVVVW